MKIASKKPHFFKPIQPGFKHGIKIPIGFLKYLKGLNHIKHSILRSRGKKWLVKVNDWRLEECWGKFAEEHDLQLGDFLIFKHEGYMEFEVSIFDSSHCDREYAEYLQEGGNNAEETFKKVEFKESATHNSRDQSHFQCIVRPNYISNGYLKIPIGFLKYLEGLNHIKHAILKRMGKKWLVKVNGWRLEEGWEKFAEEHDLQLGDFLVFKHEGDMEFEVSIFDSSHCDREYTEYLQEGGDNAEETFKKVEFKEAATHNSRGQSHFQCIVRPNYISNGYLRLPKHFAIVNGLANKKCGLIVSDERQRSWNFRLVAYDSCVRVYGEWSIFCVVNNLMEGDYMTFEVVANGENPIWKFHSITRLRHEKSDVTTPISQTPASTSADANPYFISTIKPYTFTKALLYLPMDFVKSNGLMIRSEMILIDEKQRSWSVWLGRTGHQFGIKRGWTQFRNANGIQVGDTYKFELTNNGTIPIAHVSILGVKDANRQASQKPLTG
ncbi:hypothetical protein KY289_032545 [Solanum tuberosum]|nr:hypothetical protein KY289_032545 [Solanum tuberosum]